MDNIELIANLLLQSLGYIIVILASLKAIFKGLQPIAKWTKTQKDDKFIDKVLKITETISDKINYILDFITDIKRKEGWK